MRHVYICSPYATLGDMEENIEIAKILCKMAVRNDLVPIAPHLFYSQFLSDDITEERSMGLKCALALLDKCDLVWLYSEKGLSTGMKAEIAFAEATDMEIIDITYLDNKPPLNWLEGLDLKNKPDDDVDSVDELHGGCIGCEHLKECPSKDKSSFAFSQNDFLWALKELDIVYGGSILPQTWWKDAFLENADLLLHLGITGLIDFMEFAHENQAIPLLADDWKENYLALLELGSEDKKDLIGLDSAIIEQIKNDEWLKLANLFVNAGNYGRAIDFFEKSIELNPNSYTEQSLNMCRQLLANVFDNSLANSKKKILN